MEQEVNVNGKKFVVRELLGIEMDTINFENKPEAIKKQVMLSTGIKEEDYNKLSVKERFAIVKAINIVNGFEDFQNPK